MPISENFHISKSQELNLPQNTNFRGSQSSVLQNQPDTVEIQRVVKTDKKGLSTNAKLVLV